MSEPRLESARSPAVYFIDDSATMREVMKIAFRRENISVSAYAEAAAALAEIEKTPPDVVITDVVMPSMDGFEVCDFIKRHPQLNKLPVVLLSGVVDQDTEKKAAAVKADELIRKPFQPPDLISCVKRMLASVPVPALPAPSTSVKLAFSALPSLSAAPRMPNSLPTPPAPAPQSAHGMPADAAKLRLEIARLSALVNKLRTELAGEREYSRALEEHVRTLQEGE
jgi:twitching motility two-component system response regulator PilH